MAGCERTDNEQPNMWRKNYRKPWSNYMAEQYICIMLWKAILDAYIYERINVARRFRHIFWIFLENNLATKRVLYEKCQREPNAQLIYFHFRREIRETKIGLTFRTKVVHKKIVLAFSDIPNVVRDMKFFR